MINIIDNFLEEEQFKNLKLFSKTVHYKPVYFDETTEKTDVNTYGFRYLIEKNNELINIFNKKCLEKFKYKIVNFIACGLDKRRLTMYKPHIDTGLGVIKNLYLMVEGVTKLNHGIGFYDNKN